IGARETEMIVDLSIGPRADTGELVAVAREGETGISDVGAPMSDEARVESGDGDRAPGLADFGVDGHRVGSVLAAGIETDLLREVEAAVAKLIDETKEPVVGSVTDVDRQVGFVVDHVGAAADGSHEIAAHRAADAGQTALEQQREILKVALVELPQPVPLGVDEGNVADESQPI